MKLTTIVISLCIFFVSCKTNQSSISDTPAVSAEDTISNPLDAFNRANVFNAKGFDLVFKESSDQVIGVWKKADDNYEALRGFVELDKINWIDDIMIFKEPRDKTSDEKIKSTCYKTGELETLKFECFYASTKDNEVQFFQNTLNTTEKKPVDIIWTKEENQQSLVTLNKEEFNRFDYLAQLSSPPLDGKSPTAVAVLKLDNGNYSIKFAEIFAEKINWTNDIELEVSENGFKDLDAPIWSGCIERQFFPNECFTLKIQDDELVKLYQYDSASARNAVPARLIKTKKLILE